MCLLLEYLKELSYHKSDLILSELITLRLVAATANWVTCCEATQFAMVATSQNSVVAQST